MTLFNYLLLIYAAIHVGLFYWTFRWNANGSWRLWFLRALLFGVFYDNLVTALGNVLIDSSWYEAANVPRFFLHAAILPFLVPFASSVMGEAGVAVAGSRAFQTLCLVFVFGALAFGLYHEVYLLELEPDPALGVAKLGSTADAPPWATIAANLVILPMAAAVWRKSGWPWMFLGTLFILLVNGAAGSSDWGFLAGNFAEIVFIGSLLMTENHLLCRRERNW